MDKKDINDKKTKDVKTHNVQYIFQSFHDNMDGLSLYFTKFESLAIGEDETMRENSSNFFKEALDIINPEIERLKKKKITSKTEISIKEDNAIDETKTATDVDVFINSDEDEELGDEDTNVVIKLLAKKLSKRPKISPKNFEILSRSSFLMLNNYFEYLLADLLTYYYSKFQNSLNTKEFKVSLQELNEYETIQEVTKHLILKEVESIIVEKTFDQLLEHFETFLKISLHSDIINWDKIVEFRERRHLIVHNSSIVNKKYIARTNNPFKYDVGDIVNIDKDYFNNAYKLLRVAGNILIFNCWGNWDKDNIDSAIYQMMISSFDSLNNKEYDIVLKVCKYCEQITPRNDKQEDYLLRIKINHAIAYKKQNNKTELKKILQKIQIGTALPIFKIAFQILNDDYDELAENFKKAILLEDLIIDNYLEWPIFDFVRTNEELNKTLIQTFKI